MPRKSRSEGQSMTRREALEKKLSEVIREEGVLKKCLNELAEIEPGSLADAETVYANISARIETRLSELDEEEKALNGCLETLNKFSDCS